MKTDKPLCERCRQKPASVFVTRIVHGHTSKQSLCDTCARRQSSTQEWLKELGPKIGDGSVPSNIALDDVVKDLFQQMQKSGLKSDSSAENEEASPALPGELAEDELEGILAEMESALDGVLGDQPFGDAPDDAEFDEALEDADANGDIISDEKDDQYQPPSHHPLPDATSGSREIISARCPKCATTWDRLRQDGRAGCAQCYTVFEEKLTGVMERMQREPQHTGKSPRTAIKRRRRLEQLRTKRDNRLTMLNSRLQEAVTAENYEEAAQLRDKIKMVASTIVSEE